jgi:hypothetical protein
MELTIDDQAPVIIIGRDAADAATIKGLLDSGAHLVVTVGYLYPLPWRVSWKRPVAQQRTDRARSVNYQRPDIDWRYMDTGTVVGVSDHAPQVAAAGNIGDKSTTLDQLLGLSLLTHRDPYKDLTFTRAGVLDLSEANRPGVLLTEVTVPSGSAAGTVVTLDAMIGVRAWNLDRSRPATTVSCARRPVDVVLSPEQVPALPVAAGGLASLAYKS